jgi:hypothetical protein
LTEAKEDAIITGIDETRRGLCVDDGDGNDDTAYCNFIEMEGIFMPRWLA